MPSCYFRHHPPQLFTFERSHRNAFVTWGFLAGRLVVHDWTLMDVSSKAPGEMGTGAEEAIEGRGQLRGLKTSLTTSHLTRSGLFPVSFILIVAPPAVLVQHLTATSGIFFVYMDPSLVKVRINRHAVFCIYSPASQVLAFHQTCPAKEHWPSRQRTPCNDNATVRT